MRDSLYGKFIFGYLIFALFSAAFVWSFSGNLVHRVLLDSEAQHISDEAFSLAAEYEDSGAYVSVMSQETSKELRTIADCTDSVIWLVSTEGRITYDTEGLHAGAVIPGFDPLPEAGYTVGTAGGLFEKEMLSVAAPVSSNFTALGYVMMNRPLEEISRTGNRILKIIYITAAAILGFSLILILIFHFAVYLPLRRVTAAAQEYARGNLEYRTPVGSARDEMGYLAVTLNYMAEEQANLEKYQRDFISNVSHDFRSPLTSIRGYLVAILDGTIPEELRDKYLRRVISETERLNKLTEELLTLGNLDSKGLLHRTSFDINRVIRDVCSSNEHACLEKDIQFELLFEKPEEQVYADLEKIQRVLYNLIDNAIKFSYPASVITVSTAARQKKVFVSVKDRGIGIPRASLKKIWDRFYKTDTSRGKDKRGTGLGLAIVKEIITAHNESIDVISTEKVGTEFTFSLPQSPPEA